MPNRILREGILTSEAVNCLSCHAELFYRRLMSVVDDYGRIEAHPQILLTKCFPFKLDSVSVRDVGHWLAECSHDARLVTAYTVKGKNYLQINNFGQRERVSKCPSPQEADIMSAESEQTAARASNSTTYSNTNTTPNTNSRNSDSWKIDTGFLKFIENWRATGAKCTDADCYRAYRFEWNKIGFEEQLAACDHVRTCDGAFVKFPQNYLADREWEREPRPSPKSKLDRMIDSL